MAIESGKKLTVRESVIGAGKGYRLFQIHEPRNRLLVDLRPAESLPHAERIEDVLVMSPPELIAHCAPSDQLLNFLRLVAEVAVQHIPANSVRDNYQL